MSWKACTASKFTFEAWAVSSWAVQTACSVSSGRRWSAGTCALAPQPLPPCVTVAPTMPVRIVSAIIASLLSGAIAPACPDAGDQAHAGATAACVVRRARGILRCLRNGLRSIVAGFVWRVEGGGGEITQDDAADRMGVVGDVVTGIAHPGVTCNPPHA